MLKECKEWGFFVMHKSIVFREIVVNHNILVLNYLSEMGY